MQSEMSPKLKRGRCLICREIGLALPKSGSSSLSSASAEVFPDNEDIDDFEMLETYSLWAKSCIDSVCKLIRIPESHPFKQFFLNACYCESCLQLIRDINFTLKQFNHFHKQILRFRQELITIMGKNYEELPNKDELSAMKKDKGLEHSHSTKRRFSFDEVVKMVYEKIDEESEGWTGTDFMETEIKSSHRIRIRNVLELCEVQVGTNRGKSSGLKHQDTASRSQRRRSKVNYSNEQEGDECAQNLIPTIKDEIETIPEDMDLLEDNDPDWICSDAESFVSESDDKDIDYEPQPGTKPRRKRNLNARCPPGERKPFYCIESSCGLGFDSQSALDVHRRKVHEGDLRPYHCDLCSQKYRYSRSFASHLQRHADGEPVACLECGKDFASDISLKQHMTRFHKILKPKCKICSMEFEKAEELEEHENSHKTSEQPFQCPICKNLFTNSTTLKQHMLSHADSSPVCEVCGKRFVSSRSLEIHRKIHDESYVGHRCTVCGHKFRSAGVLTQHMQRHSDEKKFVCEVCGASFKYSSGLKVHARKHAGSYPFVCHICGRGFVATHYLKNHEETHSGFLSYECKVCKKKFRSFNSLRQHERTHEPKDPNRKKRIRVRPSSNLNKAIAHTTADEDSEAVTNLLQSSTRDGIVEFNQNVKSKPRRSRNQSSSEYETHSDTEENLRNNDRNTWTHNSTRNRPMIPGIPQSIFQSQSSSEQSYYSMPTLTSIPSSAIGIGLIHSVPGATYQLMFNTDTGVASSSYLGEPSNFGQS